MLASLRAADAGSAGGEASCVRGVLRWSNTLVLVSGVGTTAVAALVGILHLRDDHALLGPFLVGLLLVVPLSLTTLRQSAMQGIGKVILGRTPESLVAPGLFLILAAAIGVAMGDAFSSGWAIALQGFSTSTAFVLGVLLLVRSLLRENAHGGS